MSDKNELLPDDFSTAEALEAFQKIVEAGNEKVQGGGVELREQLSGLAKSVEAKVQDKELQEALKEEVRIKGVQVAKKADAALENQRDFWGRLKRTKEEKGWFAAIGEFFGGVKKKVQGWFGRLFGKKEEAEGEIAEVNQELENLENEAGAGRVKSEVEGAPEGALASVELGKEGVASVSLPGKDVIVLKEREILVGGKSFKVRTSGLGVQIKSLVEKEGGYEVTLKAGFVSRSSVLSLKEITELAEVMYAHQNDPHFSYEVDGHQLEFNA